MNETKNNRRNSVHPTTLKERQKKLHEAFAKDYNNRLNLGRFKRAIRRIKHNKNAQLPETQAEETAKTETV